MARISRPPRTEQVPVTAAELRVLEARMDTLNAMLQDLVYQARRLQASTAQRRQAVSDLFGPPSFRVHWCDGHLVQDRSLLNSLAPVRGLFSPPFASCRQDLEEAWLNDLGDRGYGSGTRKVQRSASWSRPAVPISRASSATVASI